MSARQELEKRFWRRYRQATDRFGVVGLVGFGLLLVALGLALYTPRLMYETETLREAADQTRGRLDAARTELAQQPGSAQRAAQLREAFPPLDRASADLRAMFEIAQKSRIELAKGEYMLAPADEATRLRRLEVTLPLKDRYVTIKSFVADVLNAVPHASLGEFRVERPSASVDKLDARVHFTLFYRER